MIYYHNRIKAWGNVGTDEAKLRVSRVALILNRYIDSSGPRPGFVTLEPDRGYLLGPGMIGGERKAGRSRFWAEFIRSVDAEVYDHSAKLPLPGEARQPLAPSALSSPTPPSSPSTTRQLRASTVQKGVSSQLEPLRASIRKRVKKLEKSPAQRTLGRWLKANHIYAESLALETELSRGLVSFRVPLHRNPPPITGF